MTFKKLKNYQKDPSFASKLKEELKTELETYGEVKKILVHVSLFLFYDPSKPIAY